MGRIKALQHSRCAGSGGDGAVKLAPLLRMLVRGVKSRRCQPGRLDGYPPPPWATYRALMACRLVALDKRPGVCPVGIGETLLRALAKLVTRAAGDQAKTACVNLQLCAGLEAGIEGATHTVGQRRVERVLAQIFEEEGEDDVAAEGQEEHSEEVAGLQMNNLTIETAGTEEEAAEGLKASLETEVEEGLVRERKGVEVL